MGPDFHILENEMYIAYWCNQMNFLPSANGVGGRLGVVCTQTYPPPYVPVTDFIFYQGRGIVFENVEITRAFPNWVCSTWGQWRSFHSVSLHCAACDHKCLQLTFSLHTKAALIVHIPRQDERNSWATRASGCPVWFRREISIMSAGDVTAQRKLS